MFRASTDGGATFSNKTNLSNTTDAESNRVDIRRGSRCSCQLVGDQPTSDVPVARVSNDGGETFRPLVMLGANRILAAEKKKHNKRLSAQ
jgi:hypothetical protein